MNNEILKTNRWLPPLAGALVFALSFGLFMMEEQAHKRYFKDQLAISANALGRQITDRLNFYSDVVQQKSAYWDIMRNLTENEWTSDSDFHIRHCVGFQYFFWMDPLFHLRWSAPQGGHMKLPIPNVGEMAKLSKTGKGYWALSEDRENIWILIPAHQNKNLIGYTMSSVNIHNTLADLLGGKKEENIKLALFAGNKKVYANGNIVEKNEEDWASERTLPFHGIPLRLKIWPTCQLITETFDSYMAFIVLLSGTLLAIATTLLLGLLQKKSLYLQELDSAKADLQKENSEKDRVNDELRKLSRAAEQSPSSIIITDTSGNIEYVNPKFTRISGYAPEEVRGKNPRILKSGKTTPSEYDDLWQTIASGGEWHGEFQNRKKNGDCYWGSASISSIKDPQGKTTHFISSMEDITERKRIEEKLKISLLEKEILLREISHRAKNNLQVISSLIKMQTRAPGEPALAKLMHDLGNRIAAMSLVHDQILQSRDLNRIDTGRYINSLARNILASYGENSGRIVFHADIGDISLDVETCVHCGLIVNELVSNSIKHAFMPEQRGVIGVTLRHGLENGNIELIVHDNGAGLRENFDIYQSKTLGMRLVTTLAESQLHGKIELNRNRGTEFKIVFSSMKREAT